MLNFLIFIPFYPNPRRCRWAGLYCACGAKPNGWKPFITQPNGIALGNFGRGYIAPAARNRMVENHL